MYSSDSQHGLRLVQFTWYEMPVNWRLIAMGFKPEVARGYFPSMEVLRDFGADPLTNDEEDVILSVEKIKEMGLREKLRAGAIPFRLFARFGVCEMKFNTIRQFGGIRLSLQGEDRADRFSLAV